MKTLFYIIRHCEAAGNKERYFQGHTDGEVSEKGRLQLAALAERFRDIEYDAIYSSPLRRAIATAEAVNAGRGLTIVTDERLMEINGGVWEGKKWAELPELYPEDAHNWTFEPYKFHAEGGESMDEVRARMSSVLLELAERHPGDRVVCASHGCAIRALLFWAKRWPPERLNDVEWCDNTGFCVIEIEDGVPTVLRENDCAHITGELSTFAAQKWWREKDKMVYDD